MDPLFSTHCPRCGKPTKGATIMSRFNTEMICLDCDDRERAHPRYIDAVLAENAAIQAGDFNFPGIGLPADLRVKPASAGEKSQ